ncbi:uncharacterized protein [Lolium perenne]|uniref:uncharacterized protein n=1 Tax=Lolium perenne TaxID=4522 RepID=UPI0021EA6FEF|nr:uncharacterized protein LOC127333256 [Lolium perenne]
MGDATSNHPVLAPPSGHGQSSLDASHGAATGGFIALDIGALSSLAGNGPETTATAPPPPVSTPRTPRVVRSLSRKGSDRKQADGDANGTTGNGAGTGERPPLSPLFVHVAAADEMLNGLRTPGGAGTPGGKSRRLGRRPAPWLDPRRVVFLFATLSSVGTLILLYFTLSMSKMNDAGSGAEGAVSDAR